MFGAYLHVPNIKKRLPKLHWKTELYVTSFQRLRSSAINNINGIGTIPVSEIIRYARWLDIDDEEQFVDIIQSMDFSFVSAVNKQVAKRNKAKKK